MLKASVYAVPGSVTFMLGARPSIVILMLVDVLLFPALSVALIWSGQILLSAHPKICGAVCKYQLFPEFCICSFCTCTLITPFISVAVKDMFIWSVNLTILSASSTVMFVTLGAVLQDTFSIMPSKSRKTLQPYVKDERRAKKRRLTPNRSAPAKVTCGTHYLRFTD